ncbi:MAG TPA: hypothetical protein VFK50_06220 [Sphingomicrobium sp.]|nr:hypothetical protein [Sphingomicrobium sp.]
MDQWAAALEQRRGQPVDVADRSAAESDDRRVARDVAFGQPFGQALERRPGLRGFTCRHEERVGGKGRASPCRFQTVSSVMTGIGRMDRPAAL